MKILEFAKTYCADIIEASKKAADLLDYEGFSYDDIIREDDGTYVKVVTTDNYVIPLEDILSMPCDEFQKVWPHQECVEAYDLYLSNLVIIEGEEVLNHVRTQLRREQERIEALPAIPEEFA